MLELLGNIGDFVGGVGVIATVIYLAVQIRGNTASTRTTAYQSVVGSISDWSFGLAKDGTLMRIMRVGMAEPDRLDGDERAQFNMMVVSLLRHYENIHYQYLNGFIAEETWNGWSHRILGTMAPPGVKALWQKQRQAFSSEFRSFIEDDSSDREHTAVPMELADTP